jgi:hypothetical protein
MIKVKKKEDIILYILGIFFITIGIIAIINSIIIETYSNAFWVCYSGMILIGIGILFRNSFFVLAQINILTIPLLIWDFDFFYRLILDKPLFGLTDYFFMGSFSLSKIISTEHLFILPLSLYALYLIKIKRNDSWKLSIIELPIIYFLTFLFTEREMNINCVFETCFSFVGNFLFPIVWFILGICFIVIINLIIININIFKKNT